MIGLEVVQAQSLLIIKFRIRGAHEVKNLKKAMEISFKVPIFRNARTNP